MALDDDHGNKPTPDPTILTTEQLLREIGSIKEWANAKLEGRAAVVDEEFKSVSTQFALVERQRVEQKKDTKDAVDAALAAAKEAVKEQTTASGLSIAKSETATSEQLKQLTQTFTTAIQGVDRSIGDLKERVGKIESIKQGANEGVFERRQSMAGIYAAVGTAAVVLTLLLGFVALYLKK